MKLEFSAKACDDGAESSESLRGLLLRARITSGGEIFREVGQGFLHADDRTFKKSKLLRDRVAGRDGFGVAGGCEWANGWHNF